MSDNFETGFNQFEQGDFAAAAQTLAAVCASDEGNHRAKALLGAAMAGAGEAEAGEQHLRDALFAANGDPMIGILYARFLTQQSRDMEAQEAINRSIDFAVTSQSREELQRVTDELKERNFLEGAVRAYHFAQEKYGLTTDEVLSFARAQYALGAHDDALRTLQATLSNGTADTRVYAAAAAILEQKGDKLHLYNALESLTQAEPENPVYWSKFAFVAHDLGRYEKAAMSHDKMRGLSEPDARYLAVGARFWAVANDIAKADSLISDAIGAGASLETAPARTAVGIYYLIRGDAASAQEHLLKALEIDPRYAPSYAEINRINNSELIDLKLNGAQDALEQPELSVFDQAALNFVVGDAYNAKGDTEAAFASYVRANSLLEEDAPSRNAAYVPASEHTFAEPTLAFDYNSVSAQFENAPFTPIFIVGMPRSGTTLIEGMFAAHTDISSAGEPPSMSILLGTFLRELNAGHIKPETPGFQKALNDWRNYYINDVAPRCDAGAKYLVDKQPANFKAIGLITNLFPQAKIVHIRRNPVDTGLSIFRHHFSDDWPFANNLQAIAHYYGVYARYMAAWDAALPSRVITVQYEDLISSFDECARGLFAACDIPWDDAVLHPEKAARVITTFSSLQAREPVTSNYSGDAEKFSDHLAPLKESLDAAGVDLTTGALKQ